MCFVGSFLVGLVEIHAHQAVVPIKKLITVIMKKCHNLHSVTFFIKYYKNLLVSYNTIFNLLNFLCFLLQYMVSRFYEYVCSDINLSVF